MVCGCCWLSRHVYPKNNVSCCRGGPRKHVNARCEGCDCALPVMPSNHSLHPRRKLLWLKMMHEVRKLCKTMRDRGFGGKKLWCSGR